MCRTNTPEGTMIREMQIRTSGGFDTFCKNLNFFLYT